MDDDYGCYDDYGYDGKVDGCPECGGQQGYHRDACDTGALDPAQWTDPPKRSWADLGGEDLPDLNKEEEKGWLQENLEDPEFCRLLLQETEKELAEANEELSRLQKRQQELSRLLSKRERALVGLEAVWPFYCFLSCLVGIVIGLGIMAVVVG